MNDRIFVDTNILVYAYTSGDIEKHSKSKNLFLTSNDRYIISTQVLSEFYVTLTKYNVEHSKIVDAISEITDLCEVRSVKASTVTLALAIRKRYGLSYWDSLILSAALENSCRILYSEDMANGQTIYTNDLENISDIVESFESIENVIIQNPY